MEAEGSRWGGLQRSKSAPMMPKQRSSGLEGSRNSSSAKRSVSMERAGSNALKDVDGGRAKLKSGNGSSSGPDSAVPGPKKKAQYSPAESSLEDGEERIDDGTADAEVSDLNDGMPKMLRRVSAVEELLGTNSPSPSPQDLNSEESNDEKEKEKETPEKKEDTEKEKVKTPRLGWGGGLKAKLGWVRLSIPIMSARVVFTVV